MWRILYRKLILSITNNIHVQEEAKHLIGKLSSPVPCPGQSENSGMCMTPSTAASKLFDRYHESYHIHKYTDSNSNDNSYSNNKSNSNNRGSDTNNENASTSDSDTVSDKG